MLVPLSTLDQLLGRTGITMGYVIKSVDNATLEAAGKRVVDKWRLLAGRLERNPSTSMWSIRVPLEGEVSDRLQFTTSKLAVELDAPIIPVDAMSSEILVRPDLKYFRHPSTPNSMSAFSSSNAPILFIHVTELSNCACVGISVPHGVFDAFGLGQIIRSLDAELNGKAWTPPPFSETNIMDETLQELKAAAPLYTNEPAALIDVKRELVPPSLTNVACIGADIAYEYLWQKAEVKAVYLGENVVDEMVRKVKDEVKSFGTGFVSTGDIIVAWFLKTAYLRETDKNAVYVSTMVSIRSPLEEKNPAFNSYTHNCLMPCCCPSLSKEEIASKSLAELAVIHRKAIDDMRNIPFIQAYNHWVAKIGGVAMPTRRRGADSWVFSNQIVGHLDEIDFGSEMSAFWHWNLPFAVDHSVILNKFKGGYIIEAVVRRSRWEAVAEEVERMKKGENALRVQ
ncbi:hypothetical protein DXG03_008005 [Asterophora parasitica]|uniref:Uncharacterized protein n=1 Tax=Asterophora parasitica TaxID=117018 RepID=A0A9P7K6V4_9AGAR|nr:hypothetical protein DXG03_008005 [Asterophora parasitica]